MNFDVEFVLMRATAVMGTDIMQASRRVGIASIIFTI